MLCLKLNLDKFREWSHSLDFQSQYRQSERISSNFSLRRHFCHRPNSTHTRLAALRRKCCSAVDNWTRRRGGRAKERGRKEADKIWLALLLEDNLEGNKIDRRLVSLKQFLSQLNKSRVVIRMAEKVAPISKSNETKETMKVQFRGSIKRAEIMRMYENLICERARFNRIRDHKSTREIKSEESTILVNFHFHKTMG